MTERHRAKRLVHVLTGVLLAGSGTVAAASPEVSASASASAPSIDAICRSHGQTYTVREYFRGPARYTLRCGTKTWGWKHIKLRHGWNATMDKKIGAAIYSGRANGRGGFSTYTAQCPSVEKFRTILGTPAARNDLLTAYPVTTAASGAGGTGGGVDSKC
ncbi:hypothetical protein AB0J21_07355 [Streptomyces sp. NPDC049954]|uniref:hypothetical protein n=1 Tax=Streptomyces sp. NPDC049954 TaxID=3155779 RepID=UPI00343DFD18